MAKPHGRSDAHYLLGRSDREYERLMAQARWINGFTESIFKEAGI